MAHKQFVLTEDFSLETNHLHSWNAESVTYLANSLFSFTVCCCLFFFEGRGRGRGEERRRGKIFERKCLKRNIWKDHLLLMGAWAHAAVTSLTDYLQGPSATLFLPSHQCITQPNTSPERMDELRRHAKGVEAVPLSTGQRFVRQHRSPADPTQKAPTSSLWPCMLWWVQESLCPLALQRNNHLLFYRSCHCCIEKVCFLSASLFLTRRVG